MKLPGFLSLPLMCLCLFLAINWFSKEHWELPAALVIISGIIFLLMWKTSVFHEEPPEILLEKKLEKEKTKVTRLIKRKEEKENYNRAIKIIFWIVLSVVLLLTLISKHFY